MKVKIFTLVILSIILLTSTNLFAQESDGWVYATTTKADVKYYFRNTAVSVNNGLVKIWVKVLRPTYTYENKTYTNTKGLQLLEIKCVDKEYTLRSITEYSSDGSLISSHKLDVPDWTPIVPETVIETVATKICTAFN